MIEAIERRIPTEHARGPLLEADAHLHAVLHQDLVRLHGERAAVLEALPANVAILDAAGEIVVVNQAWRRFGDSNGLRSPDHGVGVNYLELCAACGEPEARVTERGLREILAGRRDSLTVEYPCHSPTRRRWFRLLASPIPDGEGAVVLHMDVSDIKSSDEARVNSERRWRQLVEALPDALLVIADGSIALCNDAAARLLGATARRDLVGEQWQRFVAPGEGWRVGATEVYGGPSSEEVRLLRLDGTELETELSHDRIEIQSRRCDLLIVRDVSERNRTRRQLDDLNRQLFRAQKLDAVGRLAGGVAHEFNNLLTAINGFGELLLQQLDGGDPGHAYATEIQRAGSRALALTRQLLTFAGRQTAHPEPLDLDRRLEGMERIIRGVVGEAVEVELRLAASPDRIWADPGQVEQVVMNLVLNARDAMPRGGRLTISTDRAQLPGGAGSAILLSVEDNGSGMDETVQSHLFDPFFTTKDYDLRAGLGLPAVHGIVKRAGGEVEVESAPGEGSELRVLWPRFTGSESPGDRAGGPCAEVPEPAAATVLVVEDEPAVRDLIATVVGPRIGKLLLAADGGEALRRAADARRVDLLLTDVVLPDMSGLDVAREVEHLHRGTRVLLMTGYSRDELRERLGDSRGTALLAKPFTPQRLLSSVLAALPTRTGDRPPQPAG